MDGPKKEGIDGWTKERRDRWMGEKVNGKIENKKVGQEIEGRIELIKE